ncbi:tyrosine-type recombinase/integrase [Nocardiopsis changdeensis]|uniref:Site-specific integrase n=1 Tax=Nocardiopsis changdeensis TaxID=2831969 RepID=A0ABX8BY49_9ACTN|nr:MULTISPECIES: site-specific integrase [Nocardiopsis]QUX25268.1 site-specific integrase [Nocardiopsis changdeensis]QYX35655.1 site-specific integrase [Nocardiopsis sp. MT53]
MAAREGSTFKRCGCRDETGRALGVRCPRLKRKGGGWSPSHGAWAFQYELPRTTDGKRRQARRVGLATHTEASEGLERVKTLLGLAEEDTEVQIADLIQIALQGRRPLPEVEEVRKRIGAGTDVRRESPSVREWLDGKPDLAEETRSSYDGHIRKYLTPHLGKIRVGRLQARHVEAMFAAVEEANVHVLECRESEDPKVKRLVRGRRVISLSTKHRIRATLRSALSDVVRSPDLPVSVNSASHVRLPSRPRKRPLVWTADRVRQWEKDGTVLGEVMVWTPEQTRTFLQHARRYTWLFPMFHLIAVKGLRRGEAVGLPWANTRLVDGQIDIRVQVVQLAWETITSTPKSAAGQRTITLDADTVKILRGWKRFQNEQRLQAGKHWNHTGLVFTRQDGSGWHPGQVSDWFCRIAKAAGLPPITLHGLRHGAASLALAGTDVKVVSAELGHATTHFTQDTYQSVYPDVAKAAAEATAALLRGEPVSVG